MQINETILDAWLQALADAVDAGSGPGTLSFYDGTMDAPADPPTGTLLGVLTLADPVGVVAGAELTFSTVPGSVWLADSTLVWARMADSDAVFVMQGTAGVASPDFATDPDAVVTGNPVGVTSAVFSLAALL
jgi:hypothetical protein